MIEGIFLIKPQFEVGKGRILIITLTVLFLYPIGISMASPPTYHYSGMPRFLDEILEALIPPPPTEDQIALEEGWFVDAYDDALSKARSENKPLFIDFWCLSGGPGGVLDLCLGTFWVPQRRQRAQGGPDKPGIMIFACFRNLAVEQIGKA